MHFLDSNYAPLLIEGFKGVIQKKAPWIYTSLEKYLPKNKSGNRMSLSQSISKWQPVKVN